MFWTVLEAMGHEGHVPMATGEKKNKYAHPILDYTGKVFSKLAYVF